MSHTVMMLICMKQYLNNICGSVHEKVKQQWGWVEKSGAYKKNIKSKMAYYRGITLFGLHYKLHLIFSNWISISKKKVYEEVDLC